MGFNALLLGGSSPLKSEIQEWLKPIGSLRVDIVPHPDSLPDFLEKGRIHIAIIIQSVEQPLTEKNWQQIINNEKMLTVPVLVSGIIETGLPAEMKVLPANFDCMPFDLTRDYLLGKIQYHIQIMEKEKNLELENLQNSETNAQMQYLVQFLQTLINTIPNPVFYKDSNGKYMGLNDAMEKFLNLKKEEIFGRTVFEIWPPDNAAILSQADEQLFREGVTQEYETTLPRGDGNVRNVILYRSVFFDENKKNAGIIGTIVDITERKHLETELVALSQTLEKKVAREIQKRNKSEIQFRHIFEHSPIGIIILDSGEKIVEANPQILTLLQYQKEEIIGHNIQTILHPDDLERDAIIFKQIVRGNIDNINTDIRLDPKDHSVKWVTISASSIQSNYGMEHAVVAVIDITEKKQMTEQIIESEDRLRMIMDRVNDSIILTDENGLLSHWNRSTEDMFGYNASELSRVHFDQLILNSRFLDERSKLLSDSIVENIDNSNLSLVLMATRKDKSTFPIDLSVTNIILDGSLKSIGVIRDITIQIESEQKQKRQEQLLIQQSKLAAMGEMIAMIAHQWRQPLNIIALLVQDLKESYEFQEVDSAYVDSMVSKSMQYINFMSNTIDNFRDFFKIDRSKELFSVHSAVMEIIRLILPQFTASSIGVHMRCCQNEEYLKMGNDDVFDSSFLTQGKDVYTLGYANEFKHVIMNILINAKDAILARREIAADAGKVFVQILAESNECTIHIEDDAGGVPEKIIHKIFDPYFTTKGEHAGTGIGLYMSKTIIENKMHGRLTVKNSDHGAVFTINLSLTGQKQGSPEKK